MFQKTVISLTMMLALVTQTLADDTTTNAVLIGTNLLVNPSAEDGLRGWKVTPDTYGRVKGGAKDGAFFFAPGPNRSTAEAVQEIDLSGLNQVKDHRPLFCVIRGYMRDFEGYDESQIVVEFLGTKGQVYDRVKSKKVHSYPKWEAFEKKVRFPPATTLVRFRLISTYHHGIRNNDGYFDDLYFGLTYEAQ